MQVQKQTKEKKDILTKGPGYRTFHTPLKCFKALDDILDVKPEKMHLNKTQTQVLKKLDKVISKMQFSDFIKLQKYTS